MFANVFTRLKVIAESLSFYAKLIVGGWPLLNGNVL